MYSCTLDMYFAPEPTIVCQCIIIGSARPNEMNLLGVSYRGWVSGWAKFPPPLSHNFPPPEILKLSIIIVLAIYVTGHKYVSYSLEILSQIVSEAM